MTRRNLLICYTAALLLSAAATHAQHDPGRNAVRLLAKGEIEAGVALVQKAPRRMNSPVDAAEIAYVQAMAACLRGQPTQALEYARAAVTNGLQFSRLQAGPRKAFQPLHDSDAYRTWAESRGAPLLHGPLLGCVTDHSARFWVRTARPAKIQVFVAEAFATEPFLRSAGAETSGDRDFTAVLEVDGLQPGTDYMYDVFIDGAPVRRAVFSTHSEAHKAGRFSVVFGGGAGYTPTHEHMWETIATRQPEALLMLGDNVYIDDPEHRLTNRYCYYRRQSQPEWRGLTGVVPVYAIYDDHDFGTNDCVPGPDIEQPPWKREVWNTFRENWNNPAYGGGTNAPGCWFDFYISDVHLIMLDTRYYRDLKGGSMLGPVQKQWLFETLKGSKGRFIVLASSVPWSPGVKGGSKDTWDGFPEEREEIFSFIETHGIGGVILMAADRHRTDLRRIPRPKGYDLYEVMSSRLTNVHTHGLMEHAKGSEFIFGYNATCSFGELAFDTMQDEPEVTYRCITIDGELTHSRTIKLAELTTGSTPIATTEALSVAAVGYARESKHMNVLFIAVDDLRPELGCYEHPQIKSPHIDALAESGLLFNRAYCQQAVCAPSRISLLTGLRPDATGIYDLKHPLRETTPDVLSMPEHFKKNGYETVSVGKIYHHHNDDNGVGWSADAWHPREGAWKGRGYLTPEAQKLIDTGPRKGVGVGPAYEVADVDDDAYPDGQTALKAVAELRRLGKGGKPFFLAVGFVKPHLPFNAPKRYWDLYDHDKIQISEQKTWPKGMPAFAGMSWGEMKGYVGIPRDQPRLSPELSRTLIHGYYACTSYTDALVGQVMRALDENGLKDNTAVILWGDHGWKLSEYSAWCKHTNFEIDTKVPMILTVPGQKNAGRKTDALVEFVDVFPTLSELCGLPVPASCEGSSMVPLLADPDRAWKQAAFSQYPRNKLMGHTLRSGQWRYTEWINRKTGVVEGRELYDHEASPVAAQNLVEEPAHGDTVKELSALLGKGKGWQQVRKELPK